MTELPRLSRELRALLREATCPTCGSLQRTCKIFWTYEGLADDELPDKDNPDGARFTCSGKPSHRWTLDLKARGATEAAP